MISFAKLWRTMQEKGATTYTLRNKGKEYTVSSSTIKQLKNNQSVSTNTLDTICKILNCELSDIMEYVDETKKVEVEK